MLDPFCGCATALVAADRLQRHWVGIDLSPLAVKLVDDRIKADRGLWGGCNSLDAPPKRTDTEDLPNYRTHRHRLYGVQEGMCAGCDTYFPFRVMDVDHILPQARAEPITRITCNCFAPGATGAKGPRQCRNGERPKPQSQGPEGKGKRRTPPAWRGFAVD